jgi:acetyl-CoA carboxylase beta subunit
MSAPDAAAIHAWLTGRVAETTGISPDQVDPDRPLHEAGLSSRDAMSHAAAWGRYLGRPLAPTMVWQYPTITALAAHLSTMDYEPARGVAVARETGEPIAVVGIGCRLPGGIESPARFWQFLDTGGDGVSDLPEGRWESFAPADDIADLPRRGGFLGDVAGFEPSSVDYVEAHGTGTALGDPLEAGALGEVLGTGREPGRPLLIGSVKSNLGHLEGAAGIAGLIKVVLAMVHRRLPPSLHYREPSPHIDFPGLGLRVVAEGTDWPRYSGVARAGVSAFGFGGTNAHVVLEEWPAASFPPRAKEREGPQVFALSARSAEVLRARAGELADWLDTPDETSAGLTTADLELDRLVPDSMNQAYDMGELIVRLVDDGDFTEVHSTFAPNMICAFGRIEGRTVGIVANQPRHQAGVIDIDASEKAARFVRFCDAFNIPLLTLADVPGYLPGEAQERHGIIRRGAKLIYAYAEATVPKVTVVTRKAYGGGYAVMGSKHLGADVNMAWPTAEIAVMGAEGAVRVLHRRELAAMPPEQRSAVQRRLTDEYRERHASPYPAAERGYVDQVIAPSQTRLQVARALRTLRTKRQSLPAKKHGNIPL